MAYLLDSEVVQLVADALKADVGELPSYWARHAARANEFAYHEVRGRLIKRGATAAQVDAWDRREEYCRDLALWKALLLGGALDGFDKKFIDDLDRREELDAAALYVDGVWLSNEGRPGQARSGAFRTEGDTFVADPRSDDVTRW